MSQKLNLQQLRNESLQEINAVFAQLKERKAYLEAAKAEGGKAWTASLQEELDDIVIALVDVEEIYAEKESQQKEKYVVEKGAESYVHVKLIRGRRFNSMTGDEMSKPYVHAFTYGEWQVFKANHKTLGYIIVEVLHDPYGDAAEYVTAIS